MTVTTILMNKDIPLVSVRPQARIESVIELMKDRGVGSVAVLDEGGGFEGIITERDILKAIDTRLSMIQPLLAKDVMSRRSPTCSLDDSEAALMDRMVAGGVQYLPVVHGRETIAIISLSDLVETRVRKIKNLMQEIADTIHIESHLEYFTRHLRPLRSIASTMAREQRVGLR